MPDTKRSMHNLLFDTPSSTERRYTKTMSINMEPEMFVMVQNLAAAGVLPFDGSQSAFGRHAIGIVSEALQEYVDEDVKTIFAAMMAQTRRLTRERIILEVDELIDQQVDHLAFWSKKGKWSRVLGSLEHWLEETRAYPVFEWKEHAAQQVLRDEGVRKLRGQWDGLMKDEDVRSWRKVGQVFRGFEELAGE